MIAAYLGVKGTVTTLSTACSSAANAIMLGARLIRHLSLIHIYMCIRDRDSIFDNTTNSFMLATSLILIFLSAYCGFASRHCLADVYKRQIVVQTYY